MAVAVLSEDLIHVLLVGLSATVLIISLFAQAQRQSLRYLLIAIAFGFLTLSQTVELVETLFLQNQLLILPVVQIHLSHFLDFLMLSSFGMALLKK